MTTAMNSGIMQVGVRHGDTETRRHSLLRRVLRAVSPCLRVSVFNCFLLSSTAYCHLPTAYLFLIPSQSALHPAGPQAGRIIDLWWMMFYVTGAVFLVVMGFLVAALARRRRPYRGVELDVPDVRPEPAGERRMSRAVLAGVALTVAILFVFLVRSF